VSVDGRSHVHVIGARVLPAEVATPSTVASPGSNKSLMGMCIHMGTTEGKSGPVFVIVAFAVVGIMWIVFANSFFVGAAFIALSLGYLVYVIVKERQELKRPRP